MKKSDKWHKTMTTLILILDKVCLFLEHLKFDWKSEWEWFLKNDLNNNLQHCKHLMHAKLQEEIKFKIFMM